MARPRMPSAPVTRIRIAPPLKHVHEARIAYHEPIRGRLAPGPLDPDFLPAQRPLDPHGDVLNHAALENDRVLDLAVPDRDVVVDRGERPDVGVLDQAAVADDERTAQNGILHDAAGADEDFPRRA